MKTQKLLNKNRNKMKRKDYFRKIRCPYIIQQIFDNLEKNKTLKIINYNKKLQKLFNISLKTYKEYSMEIEIIIKPLNKFTYNYNNKFINFVNKEEQQYFHIYFNDNKTEEKRNTLMLNENVSKIKIVVDKNVKSFKSLFEDCRRIKSIYLKKLSKNNIQDMSSMFEGCLTLEEIKFEFNTSNVKNMKGMFAGCRSLKEINFSYFNSRNVKDMSYMFSGCHSLKELNLSNINTENVTHMNYMFYDCSSLKELNLSNFNTKNVIYMSEMFFGCKTLEKLDVSNLCTNSVVTMLRMFDVHH